MSYDDYPPQAKALLKLTACSTTLRGLINDIEDPGNQDDRVDLLILCDEVINQATQLYTTLSHFTWNELDARYHPSNENDIA